MGVSDDRPQREAAQVEPGAFAGDGAGDYRGHLCGNQPVHQVHPTILHSVISQRWRGRAGSVERRGIGIAMPSSRRRVDGVEDDDVIQHERVVKF